MSNSENSEKLPLCLIVTAIEPVAEEQIEFADGAFAVVVSADAADQPAVPTKADNLSSVFLLNDLMIRSPSQTQHEKIPRTINDC